MKTDYLDIRNCDCMELMREYPDKHFDLAIVDPPYGIGAGKMQQGKWGASRMPKKEWDTSLPSTEYWHELNRVSKNFIAWGGNYYADVWPTRGFIVWDKGACFKDRDFAECEIAATSFDRNAKVFAHDPLARDDYKGKIHPTQKPVKLYDWLLANYAKPGQRILDTHMGSGSIAIACHYAKCHLTASELDPDYYAAACERIKRETAQQSLFV